MFRPILSCLLISDVLFTLGAILFHIITFHLITVSLFTFRYFTLNLFSQYFLPYFFPFIFGPFIFNLQALLHLVIFLFDDFTPSPFPPPPFLSTFHSKSLLPRRLPLLPLLPPLFLPCFLPLSMHSLIFFLSLFYTIFLQFYFPLILLAPSSCPFLFLLYSDLWI